MNSEQTKEIDKDRPGRHADGAAPDLAAVARAAAGLEIATVRLTGFTALTSYGAFEELPSDVSVKLGFTRPKVVVAGTRAAMTSTLMLRVFPKSGPPALDLRATAELVYVQRPGTSLDKQDIEEFAVANVPFNAWSYWREFVQSSMARLNLPPIALPLFRISEAIDLMVAED